MSGSAAWDGGGMTKRERNAGRQMEGTGESRQSARKGLKFEIYIYKNGERERGRDQENKRKGQTKMFAMPGGGGDWKVTPVSCVGGERAASPRGTRKPTTHSYNRRLPW